MVSEGEEYSITSIGAEVPAYDFNAADIPTLTEEGLIDWSNLMCCFLDLDGMVKYAKGPAQRKQLSLLPTRHDANLDDVNRRIDRLSIKP